MGNTSTEKRFYSEINIARGIAVLCVLFGHSFPDAQLGITNPMANWIHSMMYGFHMGFFFLLSGFVSGKKLCEKKVDLKLELIKKIKRLMVPYLFFSVLSLVLKILLERYANNQFFIGDAWKILIGINPNSGLWFLWTLFMISVIYLLLNQITQNEVIFLGTSIALLVSNIALNRTFLSPICNYAVFYAIGICLHQKYSKIEKLINSNIGLAISILSAVVYTAMVTVGLDIYTVTCILGSISIFYLSYRIAKQNTNNKTYSFLFEMGTYSYDIYLISYFIQVPIRVICIRMHQVSYWITVALMFVFGTVFSYLISKYVLRKNPVARRIMLGDWK